MGSLVRKVEPQGPLQTLKATSPLIDGGVSGWREVKEHVQGHWVRVRDHWDAAPQCASMTWDCHFPVAVAGLAWP